MNLGSSWLQGGSFLWAIWISCMQSPTILSQLDSVPVLCIFCSWGVPSFLREFLTACRLLTSLSPFSTKMATPDVFHTGGPDPFSKVMSSPRLNPSTKETQAGLKRSFAKYLASDHISPAVGKLFDPLRHLQYEEPSHIHTMEDIGFPSSKGVSPVAVSEPFRLFSEEAVDIMRAEILSQEVQENYSYASDIAPKQLRGYAPK